MSSGWDDGVKEYFVKILNTVSVGLFWLIGCATAGVYFQLGFVKDGWHWENVVFYLVMAGTGYLLFRYFYKLWKNGR